jgi:hypothetical protein
MAAINLLLKSWSRDDDHSERHPRPGGVWLAVAVAVAFLWARGNVPEADVDPGTLRFAARLVGTTEQGELSLSNHGRAALRVHDVSLGGAQPEDFRIVSDTCTDADVAPGNACVVRISFTPVEGGARTANLAFTDDTRDSPQKAILSGIGVLRGDLAISPATLPFPDWIIGAPPASGNVVLRNVGSKPVRITRIGTDAEDFATADCAGETIAVQAQCSLTVRFAPVATGFRSASLTVEDDTGDAPHQVHLSGRGIPPPKAMARVDDGLDFGQQEIRRSTQREFKIESIGTAPLRIDEVIPTGENAGDFHVLGSACDGRPLPTTLPVGQSCKGILQFTPIDPGSRTATLLIRDNAGDSPQRVILGGIGMGPKVARIRRDPPALEFNAPGEKSVTVASVGSAPLRVSRVFVPGRASANFQVHEDTCSGAIIQPRLSCSISVRFTTGGVSEGRLILESDAENARDGFIELRAPTQSNRSFILIPSEIHFEGMQTGTSGSKPIRVRNDGTTPVTITKIAVVDRLSRGRTKSQPFQPSSNCQGRTLQSNAECEIDVVFRPDEPRKYAGELLVGDSTGLEQFAMLDGAGVVKTPPSPPEHPSFHLEPSRVDFGVLQSGPRPQRTGIRLINDGAIALTVSDASLAGDASSFGVFPQDCTSKWLERFNGSCTIFVQFLPDRPGKYSAELRVASSNGLVRTAVLEAVVTPPANPSPPPGILVTPSVLQFGPLEVGLTSKAQVVIVTSTGPNGPQLGRWGMKGPDAEDFHVGAGPCTPKACLLSVEFSPGPRPTAVRTSDLVVTSTMGSGPPGVVKLEGKVAPRQKPSFRLERTVVPFGRTTVRTANRELVHAINDGSVPVAISTAGTSDPAFDARLECPTSPLPPGGSCRITISFHPLHPAKYRAVLEVRSVDGLTQLATLLGEAIEPLR